jgi:prepilin-type processing-associated H-X9-DG protein
MHLADFLVENLANRTLLFGGPHAAGCNMVFCDGSIHTVSYQIEGKTNKDFAHRADGHTPVWTNILR